MERGFTLLIMRLCFGVYLTWWCSRTVHQLVITMRANIYANWWLTNEEKFPYVTSARQHNKLTRKKTVKRFNGLNQWWAWLFRLQEFLVDRFFAWCWIFVYGLRLLEYVFHERASLIEECIEFILLAEIILDCSGNFQMAKLILKKRLSCRRL